MAQRQVDIYLKKTTSKYVCFPISSTQRIRIKKERVFIDWDYGKTVIRTNTIQLSLNEWKILNEKVVDIYKLLGFNHPMSMDGIALPITRCKWVNVNLKQVCINFAYGKTIERKLYVTFSHKEWKTIVKRVTSICIRIKV